MRSQGISQPPLGVRGVKDAAEYLAHIKALIVAHPLN